METSSSSPHGPSIGICILAAVCSHPEPEEEMAQVVTDLSEDDLVEMEDMRPSESDGTFQQVTNLLNIMDNESEEVDTARAGPDPRKTLAAAIITEKAAADPAVVLNALVHCLRVPEISTQRKLNVHHIFQDIIQQEGELDEQCVQSLVSIASKEMRVLPEMEDYVTAEVTSDTLVAPCGDHFTLVMS